MPMRPIVLGIATAWLVLVLGAPAQAQANPLEDMIREMLRPMLKQWLDENMQRVLTAALREELENSDMRRGS